MALQEEFDAAVGRSKELPKRPGNDDLLKIYALYKQATEGDNTGQRPGGFDFKAIAKYDAWKKIEGKGKEEAMQEYVALIASLEKSLA